MPELEFIGERSELKTEAQTDSMIQTDITQAVSQEPLAGHPDRLRVRRPDADSPCLEPAAAPDSLAMLVRHEPTEGSYVEVGGEGGDRCAESDEAPQVVVDPVGSEFNESQDTGGGSNAKALNASLDGLRRECFKKAGLRIAETELTLKLVGLKEERFRSPLYWQDLLEWLENLSIMRSLFLQRTQATVVDLATTREFDLPYLRDLASMLTKDFKQLEARIDDWKTRYSLRRAGFKRDTDSRSKALRKADGGIDYEKFVVGYMKREMILKDDPACIVDKAGAGLNQETVLPADPEELFTRHQLFHAYVEALETIQERIRKLASPEHLTKKRMDEKCILPYFALLSPELSGHGSYETVETGPIRNTFNGMAPPYRRENDKMMCLREELLADHTLLLYGWPCDRRPLLLRRMVSNIWSFEVDLIERLDRLFSSYEGLSDACRAMELKEAQQGVSFLLEHLEQLKLRGFSPLLLRKANHGNVWSEEAICFRNPQAVISAASNGFTFTWLTDHWSKSKSTTVFANVWSLLPKNGEDGKNYYEAVLSVLAQLANWNSNRLTKDHGEAECPTDVKDDRAELDARIAIAFADDLRCRRNTHYATVANELEVGGRANVHLRKCKDIEESVESLTISCGMSGLKVEEV
ncbi:hypothetical protein BJ508DRAFT_313432 [Ascobolus immersus RN42]|uniref:Uncharacterized protein n=1 Tax=Ascobolus immersus RN42 TaxID=1160509 RepID=A0A3N4HIV2_ASCIM|nr:hypothetical protein BJ508DRAFT_313432 [Ascobolus immersus RN42]